MSKSTSDPQRIKRILNFLSLGYSDYIAARNLLLSGLPLQGAILGSTAVEKHIKAILAVRGENAKGHLKKSHIKSLNNYLPELLQKTNPEFLEFLQKCYQLRYTDNLQPNFNIAIYARETLAELDETIFNLEFQLNFGESSNTKILTRYQSAFNSKSSSLITENYILLGETQK